MKNNRYLTAFDIADILDVNRATVYEWMKKGYIEFSLAGNLQKVTKENLLKYLEKIGNSPGAMKDFEEDIDNYFRQKDEINKYLSEVEQGSEEEIIRYARINSTKETRKVNRWKDEIKDILEIYEKIRKASNGQPFQGFSKEELKKGKRVR